MKIFAHAFFLKEILFLDWKLCKIQPLFENYGCATVEIIFRIAHICRKISRFEV